MALRHNPPSSEQERLLHNVRRLGVTSGAGVALLSLAYVCVLVGGLLTLPSPAHQIQQPWFFLMEVLILVIAPAMVILSVALHARAPVSHKSFALAGVVFMSMSAGLTSVVHFAILTLSTQAAFASRSGAHVVFSFSWPSVAYAMDILAWDIFFPLGALFLASTLLGRGLPRLGRALLFASAAFAFAGLAGVLLADMRVRNIGILGYAILFPLAAAVLAKLFYQGAAENAA